MMVVVVIMVVMMVVVVTISPFPFTAMVPLLVKAKPFGFRMLSMSWVTLKNTIRLQKFLINHSPILMIMIVKIIIIIMIVSRS